MAIAELSRHLDAPDLFWAVGDSAFQLPALSGLVVDSKRPVARLAEFKANLNYNLLMHDRLVLPDANVLLNPSLIRLLEEEPEYTTVLRSGAILPAMREGVESFVELVDLLVKGGNWRDQVDIERQQQFARQLDDLCPERATTLTAVNLAEMEKAGKSRLLRADYWAAILGDEHASALVAYVERTIGELNKGVRQTEFWEFAKQLDDRGMHRHAQRIRVQTTIASLGIMARPLDLPVAYPASCANTVEAAYGLSSPIHTEEDSDDTVVTVERGSLTVESAEHVASDILLLSPYVPVQRILAIRDSSLGYKNYVATLQAIKDAPEHTSPGNLLKAIEDYHIELRETVGAELLGEVEQLQRLRWTGGVLRWGRPVPAAVGVLARLLGADPETVYSAAGLTAISLILFEHVVTQARKTLEAEAISVIPQLRREEGACQIELYGPLDPKYWGSLPPAK